MQRETETWSRPLTGNVVCNICRAMQCFVNVKAQNKKPDFLINSIGCGGLATWQGAWGCSCGLVVEGTVNGKDNMEEKTSEVADIRRYHFSWNYLQSGSDMQWWYRLISCLTFFRSFLLIFDHTVDGKDNKMKEAMEVGDIVMCHRLQCFSMKAWVW